MGSRARLAELYGVATHHEPVPGRTVPAPEGTVVAVLAAMGVDASTPRAVRAALDRHAHRELHRLLPPCVVVRPGCPPALRLPPGTVLRVETEDGGSHDWAPETHRRAPRRAPTTPTHGGAARHPAPGPPAGTGGTRVRAPEGSTGLPFGQHVLRAHAPDGRSAAAPLIVAPDRLPAPAVRTHGLLVQLYSLLSSRSWGMGDLGDLADLADWSGRTLGTGFVQVNPLHAAMPGTPGAPSDPSPYRPSSRRFPDPLHLRVADVPEFARLTGEARGRADALLAEAAALRDGVLRHGRLIDRDRVRALKYQALELLRTVPASPARQAAHRAFLAERGQALEDHATWCALAEVYGPDWRRWPAGLRDPRSAHTARARREHLDRVDFHRWLAWLVDDQLAAAQRAARAAGMAIGLVHDLAVGVHPAGADTWARQDAFAAGMSVGAPPDAFNARGQDWGLPPWRPDTLAATGHAPFRELLRGVLRHAGALRIDHVMGLFRLWWVPEGRDPAEGTYVRYDAEAMLGVLALEAHRAGAVVIGEDLGTVGPGVRDMLAERGVLGTSVLWFERTGDARDDDGRDGTGRDGAGGNRIGRDGGGGGTDEDGHGRGDDGPSGDGRSGDRGRGSGSRGGGARDEDGPRGYGGPGDAGPAGGEPSGGHTAGERGDNGSEHGRWGDNGSEHGRWGDDGPDHGRGGGEVVPGTGSVQAAGRVTAPAEPAPGAPVCASALPVAAGPVAAVADRAADSGPCPGPDAAPGGPPAGAGRSPGTPAREPLVVGDPAAGGSTADDPTAGDPVAHGSPPSGHPVGGDRPESGNPATGPAAVPGGVADGPVAVSVRTDSPAAATTTTGGPAVEGRAADRPEPLPPGAWREACLATATTHDLPSTAARLTGDHVELRHRLGLLTRPLARERAEDAAEVAEWLALLGRLGLLPEGPDEEEGVIKAVYRFLLRTPARMVGVWLPDAVGDRRPQNLPGTCDQYPNWRLPIADASGRPVSLEELTASPRLHALMAEVARCAAARDGDGPRPTPGAGGHG